MRYLALLALLLMAVTCSAQTPTVSVNPFSVTAAPIALPGNAGSTIGGALTGVTLGITSNFALRQTNFVSTDASIRGYFGGVDYVIPKFSSWLNNISPNLNGLNFRLEATGSAGATQIVGSTNSHVGFLFGGRLTYSVAGSKTYALALEIQDLNTPGLPHRNNLVVSVGPTLSW